MPKKHPEHVNLERWLVSYADFMTLMFCFFVVMYAISKVDVKRYKAVAESMRAAFSGEFIDQAGQSGGKTFNQFEEDLPVGGIMPDLPAGKSNIQTVDNAELKRLADILEESVSYELGVNDFAEKLQIIYDDRGLVIRLSANDFYEPGAAYVKRDALPILDQMAKVLKTVDRHIRVEGHTDNVQLKSEYYPSNWELSTSRAAWIVRYLIHKHRFNPAKLEASGYAEFRPVADNKNEPGRKRNRRVEILVLGKDPV